MNKMAKGALAIGVGAALLLGGGGTLATWNDASAKDAGTIAAGELKMDATAAGIWTNSFGETVQLDSYKVVPGETLTYSQNLDINLVGDKIKALVSVDKSAVQLGSFAAGDLVVGTPTLAKAGVPLADPILTPDTDGTVTAATTFTFSNTAPLSSLNATAALGTITYKLDQQVPTK